MVEFFYHLDYLRTTQPPSPELSDSEPEPELRRPFDTSGRRLVPQVRIRFDPPVGESLSQSAGGIPTPETAPASVAPPLSVHIIEHAKVFAIAVKYQVNGLRKLATSKFKQAARVSWDHDDFTQAISVVYNSTADDVPELRNIFIDVIHDRFDTLKQKSEFEAVVTSIPALAFTLLKRVGTISGCANGHKGKGTTKFCMGCHTQFDICTACRPWTWCPCCQVKIDGMFSRA